MPLSGRVFSRGSGVADAESRQLEMGEVLGVSVQKSQARELLHSVVFVPSCSKRQPRKQSRSCCSVAAKRQIITTHRRKL
jgi:hypothetical protein